MDHGIGVIILYHKSWNMESSIRKHQNGWRNNVSSVQHCMSVVHTRPLQLYLPLPLFLVVLHFVDDTPGSDVVKLGGVGQVNILIIEVLHVIIVGVLLVRVVSAH